MFRLIILLLVLLLPVGVSAGFITGNKLQSHFNDCENNKNLLFCYYAKGYVVGVEDAYLDTVFMPACIPSGSGGIKVNQLISVVRKWLNEHPERLHEAAEGLVLAAINEAWPCPEQ